MVEEAAIEVVASKNIGGRRDVDRATRVRVGSVAAHGDVLAWFDKGGVRKEGVDGTAEHDGACGVGDKVSLVFHFVVGPKAFDFGISEAEFAAVVCEMFQHKAFAKG